jgi:hypothetical protein
MNVWHVSFYPVSHFCFHVLTVAAAILPLQSCFQDKMDLVSEGLTAQQQKANSRRPVGSSQIWTVRLFLVPYSFYYLGILNKLHTEVL